LQSALSRAIAAEPDKYLEPAARGARLVTVQRGLTLAGSKRSLARVLRDNARFARWCANSVKNGRAERSARVLRQRAALC